VERLVSIKTNLYTNLKNLTETLKNASAINERLVSLYKFKPRSSGLHVLATCNRKCLGRFKKSRVRENLEATKVVQRKQQLLMIQAERDQLKITVEALQKELDALKKQTKQDDLVSELF